MSAEVLDMMAKLITATLLGALIGFERELAGKDPSLRTFSLISLGSCMFGIISVDAGQIVPHSDPGRIAAQIVVGIGFLGAGTIFRSPQGISGLTTAALMWVTAAIGTAVGFARPEIAVAGTILAVMITASLTVVHAVLGKSRKKRKRNAPVDD